jgi:hypothetical protein
MGMKKIALFIAAMLLIATWLGRGGAYFDRFIQLDISSH